MDNYTFSERPMHELNDKTKLNKSGGHYKREHCWGHMILEVAGFAHMLYTYGIVREARWAHLSTSHHLKPEPLG